MNTRSEQHTEMPVAFLWATLFTLLFLFLSGYGLISLIHFAPPWIMAKADQDIKALTFLQKTLPEGLADYWRDYKTLPQKLDDMILWKTVPSDIKHKITYTLDDPQKSTACIRLEVDAITARRLRVKTELTDNQTDTMCQSFHFRENNTAPSIVVKHLWETDQSARPSLSTPPKD